MNLKRNSWIVKINKEFGVKKVQNALVFETPISLCRLFWSTVYSFIKVISMTLAAVAVLIVVGVIAAFVAYASIDVVLFMFGVIPLEQEKVFVGSFLWATYGVALSSYLYNKFAKNWGDAMSTKKEPSMLRQYIKAKKEKVCPIITISDD